MTEYMFIKKYVESFLTVNFFEDASCSVVKRFEADRKEDLHFSCDFAEDRFNHYAVRTDVERALTLLKDESRIRDFQIYDSKSKPDLVLFSVKVI